MSERIGEITRSASSFIVEPIINYLNQNKATSLITTICLVAASILFFYYRSNASSKRMEKIEVKSNHKEKIEEKIEERVKQIKKDKKKKKEKRTQKRQEQIIKETERLEFFMQDKKLLFRKRSPFVHFGFIDPNPNPLPQEIFSDYFQLMFKSINKGVCIKDAQNSLNNILGRIEQEKKLKLEVCRRSAKYSFFGNFQRKVGNKNFLNNLGKEMTFKLAKLFEERVRITDDYLSLNYSIYENDVFKYFLKNVFSKEEVPVELKSSLLTPIVFMMERPSQEEPGSKEYWCMCEGKESGWMGIKQTLYDLLLPFKDYFCDEKKGLFNFEYYSNKSLVCLVNICKLYLIYYCKVYFENVTVDFEAKAVTELNNTESISFRRRQPNKTDYSKSIALYYNFLLQILSLCSQRRFAQDDRKELKGHLDELLKNKIITLEQKQVLDLDGDLDLKQRIQFLRFSLSKNQQDEEPVPAVDYKFDVNLGGTTILPIGFFVHV